MDNKIKDLKELRDVAVKRYAWDDKTLHKLNRIKSEVVKKLEDVIKETGYDVEVFVGGSAAKKTFTKNFDIDIFLRFDKRYQRISDLAEDIMKRAFDKVIKLHGSRDYFQTYFNGIKIEVVPVYRINLPNEAENITDVSPFHVKWFLSVANEEIAKDVCISKVLLKANYLYGAETYRKGISGYVLEILNVYFQGFVNMIKEVANWPIDPNQRIIIDIAKHYKNDSPLKHLSPSKITPLIVIDPLDKNRNASAALSFENLKKFILLCKAIINDPSIEFFEKKPAQKLIKRGVVFEFTFEDEKHDIIATKIVNYFKRMKHYMNLNDFNVKDWVYDFDFEKKIGWLGFKCETKLSKEKVVIGPPLYAKKNVEKFKAKYNETFVKDNRVCAKVKRKYVNLDDFLKEYLQKNSPNMMKNLNWMIKE